MDIVDETVGTGEMYGPCGFRLNLRRVLNLAGRISKAALHYCTCVRVTLKKDEIKYSRFFENV